MLSQGGKAMAARTGPIGEYRFLRDGVGHPRDEVAEAVHGGSRELQKLAVVRDEGRQRYLVFAAWEDYWEWQKRQPSAALSHHEVVYGETPQRLKFDIDARGEQLMAAEELESQEPSGAALNEYLGLLFGGPAEHGGPVSRDAPPPSAENEGEAREARQKEEKERAHRFMELFLDLVLDELHSAYHATDGVVATREDLIVTDSTGPAGGETKYSYHVLVAPYVVANSEEAKGFTARVLEQLPAGLRGLVDPQVNKGLQTFRLAGSAKPGSGRTKRVTLRHGTGAFRPEDTRVGGRAGARVLARLCTEKGGGGDRLREGGDARAKEPPLSTGELAAVLRVAREAGALEGHEYQRAAGGLCLFRRVAPSHCRLCNRRHDNDNTLMLTLSPEDGGAGRRDGRVPHGVYEHCRRAPPGTAPRRLGELAAAPREAYEGPGGRAPAGGAPRQGAPEARAAAVLAGQVDTHQAAASGFENLPEAQQEVYSEPAMRPYPAVPTLAVKGQMGVGKSRALRAYIDREYPQPCGSARPPVLRFLTFRQTFSKAAQRQLFPDFSLYSEHPGDLDHLEYPRLLIQVESLHRMPMPDAPEPIALLVLDEVESIIAQFNSGLHRNFAASFAMFEWLVATAERVVVLDANLGEPALALLRRLRGDRPAQFHWNRYAAAAGDTHHFTGDQGVWLDHLHARLQAGEKAVIATNSLAEAEALEADLGTRYPEKKVGLYSSKTPQGLKDAHFGALDASWGALDVLIYTPTVSAGVSYEQEHFDVFFGHFTDASCPVETCRQMLGRVRALRTREYYIHLSGRPNNLPTEVAELRRQLYDKRTGLYRRLEAVGAGPAGGLQFSYGPEGEVRFHETAYFHLWLETARIANLSRNRFVDRFVDQVADTGARVVPLHPLPEGERRRESLRAGHRNTRNALAAAESAAVAEAAEIEPEAATRVRERLERQLEVSVAERREYQRWKLAEAYRWHGRPMDGAFVAAYLAPAAMRVYRFLRRATGEATLLESLRGVQSQEGAAHLANLAPNGPAPAASECRDLHARYTFQAHFLAIWLLRLVGFRCLTDPARLHAEDVANRLRAGKAALAAHLDAMAGEFELRCPRPSQLFRDNSSAAVLRQGLALVNGGLRWAYGHEVLRAGKAAKARSHYVLGRSRVGQLFVFAPDPAPGEAPPDLPNIPSRLLPPEAAEDGEPALAEYLAASFYGRPPTPPSSGGDGTSDGASDGTSGGSAGDESEGP